MIYNSLRLSSTDLDLSTTYAAETIISGLVGEVISLVSEDRQHLEDTQLTS